MSARTATSRHTAVGVWSLMHAFVAGQDRRRPLRASLGLGPGKVEALIKLGDGPMTLRELARALEIDPAAATVGVDQLEARGLVQRTPHPEDKRSKLVRLTAAGREAATRAQAILDEPPGALTRLESHDLAQLGDILTRLQTSRGQ